jgi:hypothetical protein
MHHVARGNFFAVLLGILMLFLFANASGHLPKANNNKEKMMNGLTVINARQNVDLRNSAYLPFTIRFKGESLWRESTSLTTNPVAAEQIAICGNTLIISYNGGIVESRDRSSGKSNWLYGRNPRSRLNVTGDGIEVISSEGAYSLLKFDHSLSNGIRVPFTGGNSLFYIDFKEQEMRYCFQIFPKQTSGPDDPVKGPSFEYVRYLRDKNTFPFVYDGAGFLLDVLHDEKKDRLCIVTDDAFRLLPCNAGSEHDVQILTLEKIYRASLDPEGNIVAVLREKNDEKGNAKPAGLARLDAHGSPVWFCPVDSPQTVIQPPAAMSPDLTYLLVAGELWRIEKGKQIWRFELPCSWQDARMTVLADESVLVAAGHALIQIAKNGNEINRMITADKITCRPILDEQGNIYIAGTGVVMCLK